MNDDDWSNWNILTTVKQVFAFYQIVNIQKASFSDLFYSL